MMTSYGYSGVPLQVHAIDLLVFMPLAFIFPRVYPPPLQISIEPPYEPVLLPLASLGAERGPVTGQRPAVDGEVVLTVAGPKSCFSSGSRSAPNVVRVWDIARRSERSGGHLGFTGCGGDGQRRSRVGTGDVAVAAAPKPRP